jgi:hypothetical protein
MDGVALPILLVPCVTGAQQCQSTAVAFALCSCNISLSIQNTVVEPVLALPALAFASVGSRALLTATRKAQGSVGSSLSRVSCTLQQHLCAGRRAPNQGCMPQGA